MAQVKGTDASGSASKKTVKNVITTPAGTDVDNYSAAGKTYTSTSGKVVSNTPTAATGSTETDNDYSTDRTRAINQANSIQADGWKPTDATGSTETDNDYSSIYNYYGRDDAGVNPGYDSGAGASGSSGQTAGTATTNATSQTTNNAALEALRAEYEAKLAEQSSKNTELNDLINGLYDKYNNQEATYTNLINSLNDKLTTSESSLADIKSAYETSLENQKKAIQAGVDQSVNTLNNQKGSVENSYANTMRQLYLDKMNAQKNIGQQMAAAGQTGGQAESTLLGLNTNYADALRQSEQAKSSALSELETAIANAQLSGSAEEANAIANNATNSVNAYTNQLNNLTQNGISLASLVNNANNQQFSNGLSLADYVNGVNNQNYSNAYNKAMAYIQYGVMPDATTLANAGIDTTTAQSLINAVNAQATAKSSSGSSTSKSSVDEGNDSGLTKAQFTTKLNAIANSGKATSADIAALEAYSGSSFEELMYEKGVDPNSVVIDGSGTEEQKTTTSATDKNTIVNKNTGSSNAQDYGDVVMGAASLAQTDGKQKATEYILSMYAANIINETQRNTLLKKYGNTILTNNL